MTYRNSANRPNLNAELSRTTHEETYIHSAVTLANAVITSPKLSPESTWVLTDYACEGTAAGCNFDQQSFKGIFMRNLAELDVLLKERPYRAYLEHNANSAYQKARNPANDAYGTIWAGPYDGSSLAKQQSAASLWVAVLQDHA